MSAARRPMESSARSGTSWTSSASRSSRSRTLVAVQARFWHPEDVMATEQEVRQIADEHADALERFPNVVGVGVTSGDEYDLGGAPVVAVYVRSKLPEAQLAAGEV